MLNVVAYGLFLLLSLTFWSLVQPTHSRAAGEIRHRNQVLVSTPKFPKPCEMPESQESCGTHLLRLATGTRLFSSEISLSRDRQNQSFPRFRIVGVQTDYPIGSLTGGALEIRKLTSGDRLTFKGFSLRNAYYCTRLNGEQAPPFFGALKDRCLANARWALSGDLLGFQWDHWSTRLQMDWIQMGMSYHLFANGQGLDSLRRNIALFTQIGLRGTRYGDLSAQSGQAKDVTIGLEAGLRVNLRYLQNRLQVLTEISNRFILAGAINQTQAGLMSRFSYLFGWNYSILGKLGVEFKSSYYHLPFDSFHSHASDLNRLSTEVSFFLAMEPFFAL